MTVVQAVGTEHQRLGPKKRNLTGRGGTLAAATAAGTAMHTQCMSLPFLRCCGMPGMSSSATDSITMHDQGSMG